MTAPLDAPLAPGRQPGSALCFVCGTQNPHGLRVDFYDDDWSQLWWVRVDGTAHITDAPNALGLLQAKYPQYVETPPPGALIVIEITRWRAWEAR